MARVSTRLAKWIEWLIRVFEIILSIFLIVGVVSAGLMMVFSLHGVFVSGTDSSFQRFLDDALLYIIGLEVALMLIKRDPHLVTDILIFAIARKMIVTMQSGVDFFLGALAILLLYIVKCYGISCILLPRQLLSNFTKHYYSGPQPDAASPQGTAPQPDVATEATSAAAHANSGE
ncbi:hypothetical protein JZ785_24285 [Alicyclobacillus curvatus]|nr:hypothetical protein JZ785_24285 [Alicyclobacillus curvatus]